MEDDLVFLKSFVSENVIRKLKSLNNQYLIKFLTESIKLCKPESVYNISRY